jgi:NitT/TauT family transport system permease protein
VLLNTISGVKQVEKLLIHSALSMGASRGFIFFKVILPAATVHLHRHPTGGRLFDHRAGRRRDDRLACGPGLSTLNSQEIFQIPSMYAGIVLLAVLGLALNYGLACWKSA